MYKLLVMAQHPLAAKSALLQIPDLFLLDEEAIRDGHGISDDPDSAGYSHKISSKMAALAAGWRYKRPLCVLADMRWQSLPEQMAYDVSCLIYDGTRPRRLAYNVGYRTDITIENAGEISRLTDLLKAVK